MLKNVGLTELIIVVLVLIIFAGSKKINEMAKNAGEATKELKKIKKEYRDASAAVAEELTGKSDPEEKEKTKPKEGGVNNAK